VTPELTRDERHAELVSKIDILTVTFDYIKKDLEEIKWRLNGNHYVNQDQFTPALARIDKIETILTRLNWMIITALFGFLGTLLLSVLKLTV
jgi:hypothetical protein